ncbi:Shikimate O-hydroxycinnamoyltransferase [Capsicum annuum]|nr:Shikimate O-hydroxycinnamoyltransferase [Capsicum annuum]
MIRPSESSLSHRAKIVVVVGVVCPWDGSISWFGGWLSTRMIRSSESSLSHRAKIVAVVGYTYLMNILVCPWDDSISWFGGWLSTRMIRPSESSLSHRKGYRRRNFDGEERENGRMLISVIVGCCRRKGYYRRNFDGEERVTGFKCGGVCLGHGIFQTLVDGVSGIHFINAWSEMTRGLSAIMVPPFINRSLLRARDPPTPPAFDHVEYHPLQILNTVPKSCTNAIFKITSDQLTLLRTRSEEHEGTTFEVLAAHIWRCMSKARGLDDDQLITKLKINTDGRTRLCPPLPQGYLGNVVFTAMPMAKSGELQSEPLTITARRVHDAVARMNDEYLRSAIDYLELIPDLSKLILFPNFPSPNLKINSWTKMPILDGESQFIWDLLVFCVKGQSTFCQVQMTTRV